MCCSDMSQLLTYRDEILLDCLLADFIEVVSACIPENVKHLPLFEALLMAILIGHQNETVVTCKSDLKTSTTL